jgi:hypothetical protein
MGRQALMVRTEAEDSATSAMFDRNFRSDGYVATAIAAHKITTRLMILGVAGSRLMAKLVSIWEGLPHDSEAPDGLSGVRAVRALSLCKPVAPLRLPVWGSISAAEKNPAL